MDAKFKKFFLALVTVALGAMSSGAMAAPPQTTFSATVNGTSYNLTYFTGSYNDNILKFNTTLMPWWGDSSNAIKFTDAVGWGLGTPNTMGSFGISGPMFAYKNFNDNNISIITNDAIYGATDNLISKSISYSYATLAVNPGAAAVPEIDGALIPQVGFLLAGLFLMFGRRKENTELMLPN